MFSMNKIVRIVPCLLASAMGFVVLPGSGGGVARAAGCPGDPNQSTGPDVIVGRLAQVQGTAQIFTPASEGGIAAFSVGTTSCNLGNATLQWFADPDDRHPVIGQNCFRLKKVDGSLRFEHLGQSWLKHGFCALSENACCASCSATSCPTLGVGCSDPYTATRNATQGGFRPLGPKWQVNATTGVHVHPIAQPPWSGTVARRLQIHISDLEVSNGTQSIDAQPRYYVEGQYVSADDAAAGNKNNNASWRPVTVSGSGSTWTFGVFGNQDTETRRMEAGIKAWKEFDPAVTIVEVQTDEEANADPDLEQGLVLVGGQATEISPGLWHYEYAVQNLNSDRSIGSVTIPVRRDAAVSNIGFHDVDYHDGDGPGNVNFDGTDWPGVVSGHSVVWQTDSFAVNASANAIRWGTLYNFRFDADVPPYSVDGAVTLGYFKPAAGRPNSVTATMLVPQPCVPADLNDDLIVDGRDIGPFVDVLINGTGIDQQICAGDLESTPDGVVDVDDVESFTDCVIAAGC